MMTKLNCSVIHCASNNSGVCCRPEITVKGDTAKACKDTCCDSFTNIPQAGTNHFDYSNPNPISDVHCTAKNCIHYKNNQCCADEIEVAGATACATKETECDTFCCK